MDEITLLWGITPPANLQLIVSRGPEATWVIYLIDTDVPQPEEPDLAAWAICSATYAVGEEFMRPEDVGSDNPYSATWGYFTPDVSPACPTPPGTQVVSAQIIGVRVTSPDDPMLTTTVESFFSFAIGSQLDEWGADFVPPMTAHEEIASTLARENVLPLILESSGGDGGCIIAQPKTITPGMAQNVISCAPPIESSEDPCIRANKVCRANALDIAHAAYVSCRNTAWGDCIELAGICVGACWGSVCLGHPAFPYALLAERYAYT